MTPLRLDPFARHMLAGEVRQMLVRPPTPEALGMLTQRVAAAMNLPTPMFPDVHSAMLWLTLVALSEALNP